MVHLQTSYAFDSFVFKHTSIKNELCEQHALNILNRFYLKISSVVTPIANQTQVWRVDSWTAFIEPKSKSRAWLEVKAVNLVHLNVAALTCE